MKEIGLKLKERREENGVTAEEAAEDLKLRPSQIIDIEEGNIKKFKDVFYLKYFIRDYAKYLGLDADAIVDEFNEFLFDYTSRISVQEIENAKNNKKDDKDKIVSPYTLNSRTFSIPKYVIFIIVFFSLLLVGYYVISNLQNDDFKEDEISYLEKR